MSVMVKGLGGSGTKADLLWTNPSPTAAMSQNYKVTADLSKYTGVIVYGIGNDGNGHSNFVYVPKGRTSLNGTLAMQKDYGRRFVGRAVWCDDTGITFGQGANGNDGNEFKNYALPQKIWGVTIKGIEV